ncbi:amidohydrolase family protein [Streptomyces kaempferi]
MHAHLWTAGYLDRLERLGKSDTATQRGIGADATDADLEARFALMDRAGIDLQVLSTAPQSPHLPAESDAVALAEAANDSYAELVARFPDRFLAFAALPLPHVDAALSELTRALDELGAVGVGVTTTVLGRTLADPLFGPLYEELDRRGAVLYVHPCRRGRGQPADHRARHDMDGRGAGRGHGGDHAPDPRGPSRALSTDARPGVAPGRGTAAAAPPLDDHLAFESPGTPEPPSVAARRLWYDTVSHAHPPALVAAVASFGADHIVLGTDFPYEDGEVFLRAVDHIADSGLGPEEVTMILDTNAADLLGLSAP